MIIYDDIWLYIWLYMIIYDYIWLYMIIYDYILLYILLIDYIYIILLYIILYYIILYHIILYHIILHYITLYYIILHYIILHYIILHYSILSYIILYYITYLQNQVATKIKHQWKLQEILLPWKNDGVCRFLAETKSKFVVTIEAFVSQRITFERLYFVGFSMPRTPKWVFIKFFLQEIPMKFRQKYRLKFLTVARFFKVDSDVFHGDFMNFHTLGSDRN